MVELVRSSASCHCVEALLQPGALLLLQGMVADGWGDEMVTEWWCSLYQVCVLRTI